MASRPSSFLSGRGEGSTTENRTASFSNPSEADITQKCKLLNQKKATLDAKADISESTRQLNLLEKELVELEEKVRNTQRLIQEEKASIANSKQEAQEMTERIQAEFAEISTLSRQIISGDDKDDKKNHCKS